LTCQGDHLPNQKIGEHRHTKKFSSHPNKGLSVSKKSVNDGLRYQQNIPRKTRMTLLERRQIHEYEDNSSQARAAENSKKKTEKQKVQ
jgi:hypothetical protein